MFIHHLLQRLLQRARWCLSVPKCKLPVMQQKQTCAMALYTLYSRYCEQMVLLVPVSIKCKIAWTCWARSVLIKYGHNEFHWESNTTEVLVSTGLRFSERLFQSFELQETKAAFPQFFELDLCGIKLNQSICDLCQNMWGDYILREQDTMKKVTLQCLYNRKYCVTNFNFKDWRVLSSWLMLKLW